MRAHLADQEATLALGALLARVLTAPQTPGAPLPLLLTGELGAGKTTLVRGLVAALPGADGAEVSSPSFNLLNLYPTTPPVAHFDLYRLAGGTPDDELLDQLEDARALALVEWAERLDERFRPADGLLLRLEPEGSGRAARLTPLGPGGEAAMGAVDEAWTNTAQGQ